MNNKSDEEALEALLDIDSDNTIVTTTVGDETIVIDLWECNSQVFELYKILYPFTKSDYTIDTTMLLALIKDFDIPLRETLVSVQYIHDGFVSIIRGSYGD